MDRHHVWLTYRDYRRDGERRVMKLTGEELVRRFLLHLLPRGFMRVRYYGYLANVHRRRKLIQIRAALEAPVEPPMEEAKQCANHGYQPMCRDCQQPMMLVRALLPDTGTRVKVFDSS